MLPPSFTLLRLLWGLTIFHFTRISRRYPEVVDQRRAIFIHIPKTAGMSIARAVYGREIGHFRLVDYQRADESRFRAYYKFSFVRNPWDRLVSAYSYLSAGGMPKYPYDALFRRRVIARYDSFEKFVLEWLDEREIGRHVHFLPQHGFLTDRKGDLAVDFLGKVENLQADFGEVCRRLGIETRFETSNVSRHRHYSACYPSREMVDKVARLYEKDIRLFSYDF